MGRRKLIESSDSSSSSETSDDLQSSSTEDELFEKESSSSSEELPSKLDQASMEPKIKASIDRFLDTLLSEPQLEQVISAGKLSTEAVKKRLVEKPTDVKIIKKLTLEDYRNMISPDYKDGLKKEDGRYCVVYQTKLHKHHGKKLPEATFVCEQCKDTNEGKKILNSIEEGDFDVKAYRARKTKSRITAARNILVKANVEMVDVKVAGMRKRKTFVEYPHKEEWGYRYNKELGLVIKIIPAKGFQKEQYTTIGIDKKCNGKLRKLTKDDLMGLKDLNVVVMKDSVEPEAMTYVEKKISNMQTKLVE